MTNRRRGDIADTTMDDPENVDNIVQEYEALSSTLEMLDGCLDQLEHRNDSLFAKLEDLLQSSKETREELASAAESISDDLVQEENAEKSKNDPNPKDNGPQEADVENMEGQNSESVNQDKEIS